METTQKIMETTQKNNDYQTLFAISAYMQVWRGGEHEDWVLNGILLELDHLNPGSLPEREIQRIVDVCADQSNMLDESEASRHAFAHFEIYDRFAELEAMVSTDQYNAVLDVFPW